MEPVAEFRAMVRPTERPQLTAFCTKLTSITQEEVDGAETLGEVLMRFTAWLAQYQLLDAPHLVLPCTCGDWDLGMQLSRECKRKGLEARGARGAQVVVQLEKTLRRGHGL